jgi:hypothetical protein
VGIGSNMTWVASAAAVSFVVVEKLIGHRPRLEDEVRGLDLTEMGMDGYYDEGPPLVALARAQDDGPTSHYEPSTFSGLATTTRAR